MTDEPRMPKPANIDLADEHVLRFLKKNPDFFIRHPELLKEIQPPKASLNDRVVDFQAFQVRNLQADTKDLEQKYTGLIHFCRDNLSAQAEIHEAVLRLISTKNLDQLLEVIAVDMPSLFDMDVVRLIVEAPVLEHVNDNMDVWQQSGVTLVETGTIDAALAYKSARFIADTAAEPDPAVEDVFINAMGLSRSAAMVKINTVDVDIPLMLAMSSRQPTRFYNGQDPSLLQFMAQVLALFLDRYFSDLGV